MGGIAGIHQPANPDYARIRRQNVEIGGSHAFSLLLDAGFGLVLDTRRCAGAKAGIPSYDPDFPSLVAVCHPRRTAPYGCSGSLAHGARTNHGAGVGLRPTSAPHAVPILGELHEFFSDPQNPLAGHDL